MDAPASESLPTTLQLNQGARATSVIVHRIPPEQVERFLAMQREITAAAMAFPGYRATDVYPPADAQNAEWVVVVHYDSAASLQRWLDSPERAEWVRKFHQEFGEFRLRTLPSGFGAWFAGLMDGPGGGPPPSWKMALTVLVTLYPTVMLLAIFVGPHITPLGMALSMLLSNIMSISILQWVVMPTLDPLLGPWLNANKESQRVHSLRGLGIIVLVLGSMTLGFYLAKG